MTKKRIVKLSAISIFLCLILFIQTQGKMNQSPIELLYLPVELLFGVASYLNASQHWLITHLGTVLIIVLVYVPLIQLYKTRPSKKVMISFALSLSIILLLIWAYFSGAFLPLTMIETNDASYLVLRIITNAWYLVLLAVYYFIYLDQQSSLDALRKVIMAVTGLLIVAILTSYSYTIFYWILNTKMVSIEWILFEILKSIYYFFGLKLLLRFYALVNRTGEEWVSFENDELLDQFILRAQSFLKYSLAYAVAQVVVRIATLKWTQTTSLAIHIPFIEVVALSLILFFVEILKKSNQMYMG